MSANFEEQTKSDFDDSNAYTGTDEPHNINTSKIKLEDFEITIKSERHCSNPHSVLEQLYLLKNDENLTRDEKKLRMQKIIREIMG
jgi:hypothetical protein